MAPLKRQGSLQTITSFASRMSQFSAINFTKHHNILAQPVTSPKELQEARTVYLESRSRILDDFNERRASLAETEGMMDPVLSANGDIKSDFAILTRIRDAETYKKVVSILRIVYGIVRLSMTSEDYSPDDDIPKPWGALYHHANILKQSFSSLRAESLVTQRLARRPPFLIPQTMTESDDMMMILNTRGTALLNLSFCGNPKQSHIVKLSALALRLWALQQPGSYITPIPFDRGVTEEEKAWIIHRLIQLVRSDVYSVVTQAIAYFTPAEHEDQARHIRIFHQSLITWQKMVNRQIRHAGNYQHVVETQDGFAAQMARLREWCEGSLKRDAVDLGKASPFTWNRVHDAGAEWVGPVLDDENDATGVGMIEVGWLKRRESGLWFGTGDGGVQIKAGYQEVIKTGYQEEIEGVRSCIAKKIDAEKKARCRYHV